MDTIEEWKKGRKKALIAICTLGISAAPFRVLFEGCVGICKGLSFEGTIFADFIGLLFFVAASIIWSLVMWFINIFKFLDYHLSIKQYEKENRLG